MEKTSNVQLHKIIKNSLASYLSYKWSKNKLYLKKRKNKAAIEKSNKEKTSTKLEKKHSIINLENDIFIYNGKTKTFTQLDLCDCFRNGLKYRKLDPFNTHSSKKKYELPPTTKDSSEDSRDFRALQLTELEDSVEQIFTKNDWGKGLKAMSPSKFDLFVQKELNKYSGKNVNVKSFNINSKSNIEKQSKNNLRSSAAIGYYKITFEDNGLQCDSKSRLGKDKKLNFEDTKKEPVEPKKKYTKNVHYKRNHHHRASKKAEKVSPINEAGIQCVIKPPEERNKVEVIDANVAEIVTNHKKNPYVRQKSHKRKKTLRKRPSSMININSSAEIRKMLNEKRSSPSFTLSNTGEYFKTFLQQQQPRTLLTYYQTSSSSRDNGGDKCDEHYFQNQHIVLATTSNPISPICSGPCGTKHRPLPPPPSPCTCTCGTTYEKPRSRDHSEETRPKKVQRFRDRRDSEVNADRAIEIQQERMKTQEIQYDLDDGSVMNDAMIDQGSKPQRPPSVHSQHTLQGPPSSILRESEYDRPRSQTTIRDMEYDRPRSQTTIRDMEYDRPRSKTLIRGESQTRGIDTREMRTTSDTRVTYSRQNLHTGSVARLPVDPRQPVLCTNQCPDPCNVKKTASVCSCCLQPIRKKKPCCECPPPPPPPANLKSKCICDILTCLRERIRIQTEQQNRNLDQILEELSKQDRELKEIRNFVEKYNDAKIKASKKSQKIRQCSCYAVTVEQGFTTDMKPLPDSLRQEEIHESSSAVQESKSSEPEIIELFGSNEAFHEDKKTNHILKKESWKALWNRNSEVKAFFVTDMLKRRSIQRKLTSSSNTTTDDYESKKMRKHWFSQIFSSKKDLRKSPS